MQQTQSSAPKTVIRRFGQSYATWFQQSKSFVLPEEPAFDVFRLYTEDVAVQDIIVACTENTDTSKATSPRLQPTLLN
jgi:hypothetical protein